MTRNTYNTTDREREKVQHSIHSSCREPLLSVYFSLMTDSRVASCLYTHAFINHRISASSSIICIYTTTLAAITRVLLGCIQKPLCIRRPPMLRCVRLENSDVYVNNILYTREKWIITVVLRTFRALIFPYCLSLFTLFTQKRLLCLLFFFVALVTRR